MRVFCHRRCVNAKIHGIMHYAFIACLYGLLSGWQTGASLYIKPTTQDNDSSKNINGQEQTLKLCPQGQVFCPGDGCVDRISESGNCPEGTVFCPQLQQCLLYEDETQPSGDYSCPEGQSFCVHRHMCVPDCPSGQSTPMIHHCLAGEIYCPEKDQCIVDCFYVARREEMDRLHSCPSEQVYCVVLDQCVPIQNGMQPLERHPAACPTDMVYCLEMSRCVHFPDDSLVKNENRSLIRSRRSSQSDSENTNTVQKNSTKPKDIIRSIQPLTNATSYVQTLFARIINSKSEKEVTGSVNRLHTIMQRLCLGLQFDENHPNYQSQDILLFSVRKFSFKDMADKPISLGKKPRNTFQIGKELEQNFTSWQCYPNKTTCPGACLGILQIPPKFLNSSLPKTENAYWSDIVQIFLINPVTGSLLFDNTKPLNEPVVLKLGVIESTVPDGKDITCSVLHKKQWNLSFCTKTKEEIKTETLYIYCTCRMLGYFGGFLMPSVFAGETTVPVLPTTSITGETPEATITASTTVPSSTTTHPSSSTTTSAKDHLEFKSTERRHIKMPPSVAALSTSSKTSTTKKPAHVDVTKELERLDKLKAEGKPTFVTLTFTIDEDFNTVVDDKNEFQNYLKNQLSKKLEINTALFKNLTVEPELEDPENLTNAVKNNKTRKDESFPFGGDDASIKVSITIELNPNDNIDGKHVHKTLQGLINSGQLDLKGPDDNELTVAAHEVGVRVEPIEISEDKSVNVAIIVGIVLGLLLIIMALIGVAVYMKMKKQKEKIQPFLRITPNLHPTYKSFHHENTLDGTIESLVRIRKRAENFAPTVPPMDSGTWRLPYGAAPPAAVKHHRHSHTKSSVPSKVHVQAPLLASSRGGNLILMQTFNGKPVAAPLPGSLTSLDNNGSKTNTEPSAKNFYY